MSQLVAAARKYVGTRFRHRGRSPNALDCVGLGWRAFMDCGIELPDFRLYGREPASDGLVKHMSTALGEPILTAPVRAFSLRVGDIIVIRFSIEPHHVALVSDYPFGGLAVIHTDGHTGRVVEHRLPEDWVKRITHVYRRPI